MKRTTKFISRALAAISVIVVALSADAAPGDIFVSQKNPSGALPSIYRIPPNGVATEFVGGVPEPTGLAFDNEGNLFVAFYFSHTIWKFRAHGGATVFARDVGTGTRGPLGLACNNAGYLFVSNGSDQIYKYAPDGTRTIFASALTPFGLAFDAAGFLFVSETTAVPPRISKFAPDGTRTTFAQDPLVVPTYLAFDSAGNLFVNGQNHIYKFTPNGTRSTFSTSRVAGGLTCDNAGNVYGADFNFVYKFTPAGTRSLFANIVDSHGSPELGFMTTQPPAPSPTATPPGLTPPPHHTPPPPP